MYRSCMCPKDISLIICYLQRGSSIGWVTITNTAITTIIISQFYWSIASNILIMGWFCFGRSLPFHHRFLFYIMNIIGRLKNWMRFWIRRANLFNVLYQKTVMWIIAYFRDKVSSLICGIMRMELIPWNSYWLCFNKINYLAASW